ncbi:hypothetical protein R1sor_012801 [Riccia sorocarpa]|uniref:Uncharacterized protein n=1 Tax=Riccia sorocarpa TaxID=122646 RepID=A0ABD3I8D7_9MARC
MKTWKANPHTSSTPLCNSWAYEPTDMEFSPATTSVPAADEDAPVASHTNEDLAAEDRDEQVEPDTQQEEFLEQTGGTSTEVVDMSTEPFQRADTEAELHSSPARSISTTEVAFTLSMKIRPMNPRLQPSGRQCGSPQCIINDIPGFCKENNKLTKVPSGAYVCQNTDGLAQRGPTNGTRTFKNACPDAYSYNSDNATSVYTCPTGTDYQVIFCPDNGVNETERHFSQ